MNNLHTIAKVYVEAQLENQLCKLGMESISISNIITNGDVIDIYVDYFDYNKSTPVQKRYVISTLEFLSVAVSQLLNFKESIKQS